MEVTDILVEEISLSPHQMRKNFVQQEIEELAASIQSVGLLQPLVVRKKGSYYELISGERRLRAVRILDWKRVPAALMPLEKTDAALSCLIENIQRVDLNPMEIAAAFSSLLQEWDITHEELAKRTGKNRSSISNYLRLNFLPAEIKQALVQGALSFGHAKVILSLTSQEEQLNVFRKTLQNKLSVRDLERLVAGKPLKRKKHQKAVDPHLQTVEEQLMCKFGTKVSLNMQQKTLSIHWMDREILERILNTLGIFHEY